MKATLRLRLAAAAAFLIALAVAWPSPSAEDKGTPGVVIDKEKRTITIDAKIAPRKIDDPRYKEIYPIEVIACWPFDKGQKAHETVVTIDVKVMPSDVHKGLVELGLKPGEPVLGDNEGKGPEVKIFLEIPTPDGETKKVPIEKTLIDPKTNKPMPPVKWRFTGSAMVKPDPNKTEEVYGADVSGTFISIFPVTNQTIFQTNLTMKEEKFVKLETDKKLLPKEGTPVKLILEVPAPK
jgi:hypothetical protein